MGSFITGEEALMPAFYGAGAEIVYSYDGVRRKHTNDVLEDSAFRNLKFKRIENAYAVVFLAADSAMSGSRTVCITTPEALVCIAAVSAGGKPVRECVFVIIYDKMPFGFIRAASGMKLPLWMADEISDIGKIIRDACAYSNLEGKPCIVLMCGRLLSEHSFYDERLTRRRVDMVSESGSRQRWIRRQLQSDYNHVAGSGEYGVIAVGEAYGYAEEITENLDNIRLMRIDNPAPWPEMKVRVFLQKISRLIIIEPDGYISDMVKTMISETAGLKLSPGEVKTLMVQGDGNVENIHKALSACFNQSGRYLKNVGRPEEIPNRKKPAVPEPGKNMCPGCPMRTQVVEHLLAASADVRITEEIYCAYARAMVNTGIKLQGRMHMIVTTHPDQLVKTGIPTVKIDSKCRHNDSCKKEGCLRVNERICDMCRRCILLTGCPALWDNGISVKIDQAMCAGCRLCASVCEKGAIIE